MSEATRPSPPRPYRAYLLRLWQVEGDVHPDWRASLEDPHSGERIGFADLGHLFEYLEQQTADAPHTPA